MKKITKTIAMNLGFALLANLGCALMADAAQAKVTCNIENLEEKLGAKLVADLTRQVYALKENKGIEAVAGSVHIKAETYGGVEYPGGESSPLIRIAGSFRSKRGTNFKIVTAGTYAKAAIQFDPYLNSKEFDSEGNAITGECLMRSAASMLVVNADTEQTVAELPIPANISIK